MTQPINLSEEKKFALEVLDIFNDLAQPELKNRVFIKIWDYVKGYTQKVILKKPDHELTEKLLIVHKKLSARFQDVSNSVQMNIAEQMGSIPIPKVGELARVKNLTKINKEQAAQLAKEIGF